MQFSNFFSLLLFNLMSQKPLVNDVCAYKLLMVDPLTMKLGTSFHRDIIMRVHTMTVMDWSARHLYGRKSPMHKLFRACSSVLATIHYVYNVDNGEGLGSASMYVLQREVATIKCIFGSGCMLIISTLQLH